MDIAKIRKDERDVGAAYAGLRALETYLRSIGALEKPIEDLSAHLKDKELIIKVTSKDRMLLEKGLFRERTDTFEEVFGVSPKLLVKRVNA